MREVKKVIKEIRCEYCYNTFEEEAEATKAICPFCASLNDLEVEIDIKPRSFSKYIIWN